MRRGIAYFSCYGNGTIYADLDEKYLTINNGPKFAFDRVMIIKDGYRKKVVFLNTQTKQQFVTGEFRFAFAGFMDLVNWYSNTDWL